ncbi:hypothetical protein ColTof4_02372 [Colletotrichum tofieldiae]|nr:hypothetical protein ColTof3_09340 [Colletotrichum tofieldiae]GKT69949.1 hypothetical protein ColTof4_02372 [Colletotrichum tofieldiae]GKT92966.1 hypothetical protein Ct61P_10816 [Colletotrichum tofieldiae]
MPNTPDRTSPDEMFQALCLNRRVIIAPLSDAALLPPSPAADSQDAVDVGGRAGIVTRPLAPAGLGMRTPV